MFHIALVSVATVVFGGGLLLAVLSQRYWFARGWQLAGLLRSPLRRRAARTALALAASLMAILASVSIFRNHRGIVSFGSWWNALLGFWLSSSILAYLCVKAVAAAEWLWGRMRATPAAPPADIGAPASDAVDPSRRQFFRYAGIVAGTLPFASMMYGFASERLRFQVREVEIPIPHLPAALDGLRIAQLSDIHIGSYMPVDQVRRAVGMANELRGDIAMVTGDFLTSLGDPLEACIAELSRLRAALGIWGCNGNHEIYAHAQDEAQSLFQQHGMKLLRHENSEVRWNGAAFNLIGVDYQMERARNGRRLPMLAGVESLLRRDVPNILLSHNPNSFPRAAEMGIELSIAGHTHGGQVRVEILDHRWSPAAFLTPYVAGLYRRPIFAPARLSESDLAHAQPPVALQPAVSSAIYVNRGLGTIGAPVRLGVPPEITLIKLRCA